ncbi:hypothetical protein GCM10011588_48560 [Nocardia jinanensis]|uniref:Uncharacterized protein n=1 Tax=Nocardia jinanensis TaxID=382504 RepID=A0A917VXD7_9NOCA|nr:hypothetical protein GCM10011588_48560 [Nocardia jinanensis]
MYDAGQGLAVPPIVAEKVARTVTTRARLTASRDTIGGLVGTVAIHFGNDLSRLRTEPARSESVRKGIPDSGSEEKSRARSVLRIPHPDLTTHQPRNLNAISLPTAVTALEPLCSG